MRPAALALALLVLAGGRTGAQTWGDRLQLPGETVVFSFWIASGGKTASVLHSPAWDYLVYRFGTPRGVELEYPARNAESWTHFQYYGYMRPSMGETNEGLDLSALRFENGGYRYELYEELSDGEGAPSVGIRVSKDGVVLADLAGDPATALGSLIVFRFDFAGRVAEAEE